ncbi:helix-turn-helix domain-containing protein [Actinospica sp. MGRD01-02]|uniref:Helix-turn-helix domain-containing protein n=1 Tax=Actinospica acidithermotolerans TaxID=2828514 RepID=A0A941EFL4_9ACTN|nr:helix-turn-helix transcriptional regulator [Actinospica acidithermotolerans]MBR7830522.1 helix-turn-helix domain-containing protein [Actinospica acidithermotolerans]
MTQRSLLASFLRTRREAISPQDAGFAENSRRRTPGLRREEVAQLSGVSVTWYTWLEQGRDISASRQVLESLARTLRLTPAERRHLFTLAGAALPEEPPQRVEVSATLRALLETLEPNPAHVINSCWDLLAYNRPYEALVGGLDDLPEEARNSVWLLFTRASMRTLLVDWHREAREILGQFRASTGRHPNDARTVALINALQEASPTFTAMWSEHPIQAFSPATKRFSHPRAGRVDLSYTKLSVTEDPTQHLVVFLPATPQDAEAMERLTAAHGHERAAA